MSEFVIITGLSGAGRSQAADDLEDLGWFVIDNLPTELIPKVVELVRTPRSETPRVALVVGAGAHHAELLPNLTMATIGDRLSAKGIPWAWYSGGWSKALVRVASRG